MSATFHFWRVLHECCTGSILFGFVILFQKHTQATLIQTCQIYFHCLVSEIRPTLKPKTEISQIHRKSNSKKLFERFQQQKNCVRSYVQLLALVGL